MAVWCLDREGSVCPVVPLPDLIDYQSTLASTHCEEMLSARWGIKPCRRFGWTSLPEAVGAEGMPAGELDRTGPLAQADAALIICACVHFQWPSRPSKRRCILSQAFPLLQKSGVPDVPDGVLSASPVRRRAPDAEALCPSSPSSPGSDTWSSLLVCGSKSRFSSQCRRCANS